MAETWLCDHCNGACDELYRIPAKDFRYCLSCALWLSPHVTRVAVKVLHLAGNQTKGETYYGKTL